ncbi:hypothetical protein C0J52_11069 [Blattella germanica]|nr:hypothetical protein C0J52_11069 [Blattella germanica]
MREEEKRRRRWWWNKITSKECGTPLHNAFLVESLSRLERKTPHEDECYSLPKQFKTWCMEGRISFT